jgi:hypothetical protein
MPRTVAVEDLTVNCIVLARVTSPVLVMTNGCQGAWNMTNMVDFLQMYSTRVTI